MSGNSIGRSFVLSTFGESHGVAIGGVVDGCPPGIELSESDIQIDLDRRKPGTSRFSSQRKEADQIKILSGVFEGKTTGTPIGLLIENQDQRSKDYTNIQALYRPSHADYTYDQKYGFRDYRGGGRSSARETAIRVAAGAIAKKVLASYGIKVRGYLSQLGPIKLPFNSWEEVNQNPFFAADKSLVPELEQLVNGIRKQQNSIGAKVTVIATGIPPGLGEPVFDRLDAELAKSLMSINAVKAVAIGDGFDVVEQVGTEHRDEITSEGFCSNHAGGILGGISTGQDIVAHLALKPTPSISQSGQSIDRTGRNVQVATKGRHDPCVGIRATPIAEAMTALVLVDHFIRDRGQCAKVVPPLEPFN